MIYRIIVKDVFAVNCYFYIDDETRHGFLIDPGAQAVRIVNKIAESGWTIERILLTHGHFDHTGAVAEIARMLGIPYSIHRAGAKYLTDTRWNLSAYCDRNVLLNDAEYFDDNDVIRLDSNPSFYLKVIHTPGHTPDSVVFYNKENHIAFVGDTIFRDCPGTTRYIGGNEADLFDSILKRVMALPDNTILYSGHSEPTSVGRERPAYHVHYDC
ncbi:MAG: MBL fold metallo-hydrolase [Bacteroidales bacterium]|nr:MBL fold metallo-hydrolase [Bacteroidales bacterium]